MKIELIPVIEVSTTDAGIKWPDLGPFWEYAEEWENYNRLSNSNAGFSDQFKAYLKGSSLYKIDEISDADLVKVIYREINIQQTNENRGVEDVVCAINGGYILRVDDNDLYYPQCCGDLADIELWENITQGKPDYFYAGHPSPVVTENGHLIRFDFVNSIPDDHFCPPVLQDTIEVDKALLALAIEEVKEKLVVFAARLRQINERENIGIDNIDKKLIWDVTE